MVETVTEADAAELVAVETLVLETGAVGYTAVELAADEATGYEAVAEDETGAADEAAELLWPAQPELSMRKGCDHWKMAGDATMVMVRP